MEDVGGTVAVRKKKSSCMASNYKRADFSTLFL
jgi:hypothetical protein